MKAPAKILVVDDTPKNVKLLADILTARGYNVVTAASGAEALSQVEAERPDLVLLDVVMPEMSGYEVCRKLRSNPATELLPVVMVTALDPGEERVKGIEAGADDFLTKPINQAELLARVKSLIRIKELYDIVQNQAAELADWNQSLERRVREQAGTTGTFGTTETFLLSSTCRVDRLRRYRGSAENSPARDHRSFLGPSRLYGFCRDRRARGCHGSPTRVSR